MTIRQTDIYCALTQMGNLEASLSRKGIPIVSSYRIQVCSDIDYENLIAEMYFQDTFLALISCENGIFEVEFPQKNKGESEEMLKIPLSMLLDALSEAKSELSKSIEKPEKPRSN